ncbi:MAG: DOMON domain-containing protein, partial [Nostoc sp.]
FNVQNQADNLALVLNVDLGKIVSAAQEIEVGITTVIKHRNGEVTYWALTHRGGEADFHLRDSFIIEL